nr:vegetative cell wall protein gp1-like [Crassostrea gigas]
MSSFVHVAVSYPRVFTRQVLELWDYQWNPVQQRYDRVSFRVLHMFEPDENPQDDVQSGEFFPPRPVMIQELLPSVQERLVPASNIPPPRPPPPNFGATAASPRPAIAIPMTRPAVLESPASPDPVEAYSPTDTPHEEDHAVSAAIFARPAANPPLQPAPEPRRARVMSRRRAPSPPRPLGRGRGGPYVRPTIPSEDSAFGRPSLPFARARNLFADFIPNIESPPSPLPMVRTFPGPPAVTSQPVALPRTPSPPLPELPPSRE